MESRGKNKNANQNRHFYFYFKYSKSRGGSPVKRKIKNCGLKNCGWLKFRGVPIFVVLVEGPIQEFQYPGISVLCMIYERKYYGQEF